MIARARGVALLPTAAVNLYQYPMPKIRLRTAFGNVSEDVELWTWTRAEKQRASQRTYISTPRVRSINVAQSPRPRCRIQVTFSILSSSPCNVRTKSTRSLAGSASDPAETETSASARSVYSRGGTAE